MENKNEEVYKEKICKYCELYKTCNHKKFFVNNNNNRLSLRCVSYVYTNRE